MNQQYRIGDQLVIYKLGEFQAEENGEIKIGFRNRVDAGTAWIRPEYVVRGEDGCSVAAVGTVVGAWWDSFYGECTYTLQFEDKRGEAIGFASRILESILTPPAAQVMQQFEIDRLRERGISA